jgi:hypothetical protein
MGKRRYCIVRYDTCLPMYSTVQYSTCKHDILRYVNCLHSCTQYLETTTHETKQHHDQNDTNSPFPIPGSLVCSAPGSCILWLQRRHLQADSQDNSAALREFATYVGQYMPDSSDLQRRLCSTTRLALGRQSEKLTTRCWL